MNRPRTLGQLGLLAACLLSASPGWAALITEPTRTFHLDITLADLQDPPLSFLATIDDSLIVSLTRVEVGLRLVGQSPGLGFAGEMFVSLNKDLNQTAILLNQPGVSPDDPVGAWYDGWDVTFRDGAPLGDIHAAALPAGVLTGTWAPDGRVHPEDALRPLLLDRFHGQPGNGAWRLNVADVAWGGRMRLESWSLTLTGHDGVIALPESGPTLALLLVSLLALRLPRRISRPGHGSPPPPPTRIHGDPAEA